ncbi:MAG: response regulator [Patescibacteria group bacterium]
MPAQEKKILIVEDEKPMVLALELKLKNAGFKTKTASNGEEALETLSKEKFDLILLDLVLPEKNGFAVLAEMRGRGDETPVIVLSNLGQKEDIKRTKELGAANYFVKAETSITEIVGHIKNVFAKKT